LGGRALRVVTERCEVRWVCRPGLGATPSPCATTYGEDYIMLKWALICAVVAVIAGVLGFTGVAGAAAGIAKFLFFAFLVIFIIVLILGIAAGRKVSSVLRRKD
jgi:uncharacterized membrane protein YtjA (UPF0391 family)